MSVSQIVDIAHHQYADDREYKLIKTAADAAAAGNWTVGECASLWLQQYGRGKNDANFAELVGLTEDQAFQRRKVWERFGKIHTQFRWISWSHFREAKDWADAEECLRWAEDQRATIRQMAAWRLSHANVQKTGSLPAAKAESVDAPPTRKSVSGSEGTRPQENSRLRDRDTSSGHGPDRDRDRAPDVSVPVADQRPEAVPELKEQPTETVSMALDKLHDVIEFVLDHGTEEDVDRLREIIRNAIDSIEPLELTATKKQATLPLATRSMAMTIVDEWNMIDGVVRCASLTDKRRKSIAARLKDQFWQDNWRAAIDMIRELPALHGKNDRNWRADIEWFLQPDTVAKVIEGKYANWKPTASKSEHRREKNQSAFDEVLG